MPKAKVAALKVKPATILKDIQRLCELAGMEQALAKGSVTILKDNISWHYPFPGANTTPWQLEGTIQALRAKGYERLTCVQNKTVVTNAFKGEDLNHYRPICGKYDVPILYNFKDADMKWVDYKPKAQDARPQPHLPRRHQAARLLLRQEHRPPADGEVPHLHHHHRGDEERLRRPAGNPPPLHPQLDSPDAGRPAGHPEGDPLRAVRHHGRHHRRQRTGTTHDVPGDQGLHAGLGRSGGHRRRRRQDDGLRSR